MASVIELSPAKRLREASKVEAAEFFDVTPAAIDGWIRRGCPVVQRGSQGRPWKLDLLEVAKWKFGAPSGGPEVDPDSMTPADRDKHFAAELKKRELAQKDRELLPAAEVEQAIATAFAAIALELRAIPDHLERRAGISAEVAEKVEGQLFSAMDALATKLQNLASVSAEESAA